MTMPAVLLRLDYAMTIPDGRADEAGHRSGGTRFEGMRLQPAEA